MPDEDDRLRKVEPPVADDYYKPRSAGLDDHVTSSTREAWQERTLMTGLLHQTMGF